ncbi:hypothetical protein [uncultured Aquimarina sp.]|uniref:hypothetical protein n=1 Tax=uncultured Aquimarina sp. TaxID=575652 RepID=UPI002637A750|nr:hypothetical protein [uncultured Aquimarina sp.]
MSKTKFSHKVIAVFLTLNFLQSFVPYNMLLANNNGPAAPEASSFEPVDASDMVNLATGDLAYVLPLLNVPSPEGGYPLSLSYHAGIAMDQEASWVGLGWTLNPGAINRSVNGYPDDWNDARFKEYFYDAGGENSTYTGSLGYTSFSSGGLSVGLSLSYSDDRGFGGSVSYGFALSELASAGVSVGTDGASVNASTRIPYSPFSIGGSIGTNGVGVNVGYGFDAKTTTNGSGYWGQNVGLGLNSSWSGDISVNASYSAGEKGKKNSVGINFSSKGVSVSGKVNGVGAGANIAFENAVSQSDYNIKKSGFFIPIVIPTGEGMITASFGYQKVTYDLDKLENTSVTGPVHFKNTETTKGRWLCFYGLSRVHEVDENHVHNNTPHSVIYTKNVVAFNDIYEVDFRGNSTAVELDNNNAVFPNYDNYRVTAQGLSGSMKPRVYRNSALLGFTKDIESNDNDYKISYKIQDNSASGFNINPNFHFENEYSSSLLIEPANFKTNIQPTDIFGYLNYAPSTEISHKKGGRFVESFTNKELANNSSFSSGLLKPNTSINYGDSDLFEPDGIGAFKITSPDGKTYHYALPVYNHEVVSRQFGFIAGKPDEDEAFFEKRQLEKYATHWLLTAVTGPDFVDTNGNKVADEGDYGYWVNMEYGKWSDGYIWYAPHGKEYNTDRQNPDIKNYTWGRKEIYYLDKINTRTHTALFIKEERNDSQGKRQIYEHRLDKNNKTTLNFKAQALLRLREIILLKNEDAIGVTKTNSSDLSSFPPSNHNHVLTFYDPKYEGGGTKTIRYSLQDNVLDRKDLSNWDNLRSKALKIIDFTGYSYELADGAPYTFGGVNGRLSLKHLTFKGKGGQQLMPPYSFEYNKGSYQLNQKDEWGYNRNYPQNWSLREIKVPTGGKIQIEYEPDSFTSATNHELSFPATNPNGQNEIFIESSTDPFIAYNATIGTQLGITYRKLRSCKKTEHDINGDPLPNPRTEFTYESYNDMATVTQILNGGYKLKLRFNNPRKTRTSVFYDGRTCSDVSTTPDVSKVDFPSQEFTTGIRVRSIKTTDGIVEYTTAYDYNYPGTNTTSGVVSYIPFVNEVTGEVPYGIELPPPIPMYGHVKTTAYGNNDVSLGHMQYEFKVLPVKHKDIVIGYADILEADIRQKPTVLNTSNNVRVEAKSTIIKDNMSNLGQLLSTASYNSYGQLITKTINNYKSPENITQGVTQESFQTYKEIDYVSNTNESDKWLVNSSTRIVYPSVLESTTTIQGGFSSTTYFDKYDNTSAQLLETRTESSDGTEFKTEVIPAYTKYPVLGSKTDNINNKNMLTQEAMTKSYINQSGNWIETGVGITTWKNWEHNIWRKHKTYTWDGQTNTDGLFVGFTGSDDGFNWNVNATNQPTDWKLLSEVSKYDRFSMSLETIDINNNRVALKMGDKDTKTIAVGNAAYNEMYYSGAEYISGSNFDDGIYGIGRTQTKAHTGKYSINISSQQGFRTNVPNGHRSGTYKISVWASKNNYTKARVYDGKSLKSFNGEKVIAGDWVLLNHYVDWDTAAKTVYVRSASGSTYFDDFRIHPVQSAMATYVYNEWDELSAILGSNNLATTYTYDAVGRLIQTHSEVADDIGLTGGLKKIAEHRYTYSESLEDASTIDPLFASVTYGSSSATHQTFVGKATGGSGNYSFKWYKSIGSSSTDFQSTPASTSPTFTWSNLSGCNIRWVRLIVTDNQYSNLGQSLRTVRNDNECDDGSGGGDNHQ